MAPTPINNVSGLYLAAAHVAGSGSLALNAGAGVAIQAALDELDAAPISPTAPLRVTVCKSSSLNSYGQITDRSQLCIFDATGLSGDTLTGVSAVEGKTDLGFSAGDRVGCFFTAGMLASKMDRGESITSSQLPGSNVAPGSYSLATFVVDTKGRITSATVNTASGLLKGDGAGAVSAATAGTDYLPPNGDGSQLTNLNGANVTGNIGGNAANVTGTVAVANGGTGATSAATALDNLGVTAALATKADDSAVVHKTGSETIAGNKTFTSSISSTRGTTNNNEAFGAGALAAITTGTNNAAVGFFALRMQTTEHNSTALGWSALASANISGCTAIGYNADGAKTTGFGCTAVGSSTSTGTFVQSTAIGILATCTADNQVMLGTATETVSMPGKAVVAGWLQIGTSTDAAIPNGGIAWSLTTPGALKTRDLNGTLKTFTLT